MDTLTMSNNETDYGIKIKQDSDLFEEYFDEDYEDEDLLYNLENRPFSTTTNTDGTNCRKRKQQLSSLDRDDSVTVYAPGDSIPQDNPRPTTLENHDSHMFTRRKDKDKPPLYLLNPEDFAYDPAKQHQIRRAIITYRHHQEKKALIRRLTEENNRFLSVIAEYRKREHKILALCTCKKAADIIISSNPEKILELSATTPTPLRKVPPLPPTRRQQEKHFVDLQKQMNEAELVAGLRSSSSPPPPSPPPKILEIVQPPLIPQDPLEPSKPLPITNLNTPPSTPTTSRNISNQLNKTPVFKLPFPVKPPSLQPSPIRPRLSTTPPPPIDSDKALEYVYIAKKRKTDSTQATMNIIQEIIERSQKDFPHFLDETDEIEEQCTSEANSPQMNGFEQKEEQVVFEKQVENVDKQKETLLLEKQRENSFDKTKGIPILKQNPLEKQNEKISIDKQKQNLSDKQQQVSRSCSPKIQDIRDEKIQKIKKSMNENERKSPIPKVKIQKEPMKNGFEIVHNETNNENPLDKDKEETEKSSPEEKVSPNTRRSKRTSAIFRPNAVDMLKGKGRKPFPIATKITPPVVSKKIPQRQSQTIQFPKDLNISDDDDYEELINSRPVAIASPKVH